MSILFTNENVFIKISLNKRSSTTIWVVQKVDDLVAPKNYPSGRRPHKKRRPEYSGTPNLYLARFHFSISCGSSQ